MCSPSEGGNIVLIGFMGAGKSTVGRELGRLTGYRLVDVDAEIVRRQGRSIPAIFAAEGETVFRDIEADALRSLAGTGEAVIATGGGIVGREENWSAMRRLGRVVYLRTRWETLCRRLAESDGRPLAARDGDMSRVKALWLERRPLYEQADCVVDTDDRSATEVAQAVVRILEMKGVGC